MEATYTSWETIRQMYPDRFVLLENPVYERGITPKEGIFLYKNKHYKNVVKKELELKPHYSTIEYTGGIRLDSINESVWVL
jgi:hypothetical protein